MTKLTKEQIEQERIKFEEWIRDDYFAGLNCVKGTWDEARNCYKDYPAHIAFKAWLARAELDKGN